MGGGGGGHGTRLLLLRGMDEGVAVPVVDRLVDRSVGDGEARSECAGRVGAAPVSPARRPSLWASRRVCRWDSRWVCWRWRAI